MMHLRISAAFVRTVLTLTSPPLAMVHEGGILTAVCAVSDHVRPPSRVDWAHNGTVMPPSEKGGGGDGGDDGSVMRSLKVETIIGARSTVSRCMTEAISPSRLPSARMFFFLRMMLAHVTYQQAGNYTCVPVGLYDDYEARISFEILLIEN